MDGEKGERGAKEDEDRRHTHRQLNRNYLNSFLKVKR